MVLLHPFDEYIYICSVKIVQLFDRYVEESIEKFARAPSGWARPDPMADVLENRGEGRGPRSDQRPLRPRNAWLPEAH